MQKIIILSGLTGSGKTYLANEIKKDFSDSHSIAIFGATKKDFAEKVLEHNEEVLFVEMHPPMPSYELIASIRETKKLQTIRHIVISKNWTDWKKCIDKKKIKYYKDNNHPEVLKWMDDIIEYNKVRFGAQKHYTKPYNIFDNYADAYNNIRNLLTEYRRSELYDYITKDYGTMMYQSLSFMYGDVQFEGTSNVDDRIELFDLNRFFGDDKLENRTFLDIGCNVGYVSYLLSKKGMSGIGIDNRDDNIRAAYFLKQKFFRNRDVQFGVKDFMELPEHKQYDYIFALAVLHHIALDNKFEDIIKGLASLCKKKALIEIHEKNGLTLELVNEVLEKYFSKVEIIGNTYLPVKKEIVKDRWIIHCTK